jgi:hypothetical protein
VAGHNLHGFVKDAKEKLGGALLVANLARAE